MTRPWGGPGENVREDPTSFRLSQLCLNWSINLTYIDLHKEKKAKTGSHVYKTDLK